jgi:hypothetical protein
VFGDATQGIHGPLDVVPAGIESEAERTDPQSALRAILPGWFYPVFLLIIAVGANALSVQAATRDAYDYRPVQTMAISTVERILSLDDGVLAGLARRNGRSRVG